MYEYKAEIVRVVDGDTVDLIVDLGFGMRMQERFRLYGINAPESRTRDLAEKRLGKIATSYLISRIGSTTDLRIRTFKDSKGKFGRYLCVLMDDDININEEMVSRGFAEEYMK